jgi:hypothetical protein
LAELWLLQVWVAEGEVTEQRQP